MQQDITTVSIPLLARDGTVRAHTIVDVADADWIRQWTWGLHRDRGGLCYAHRGVKEAGANLHVFLHRELLKLPRRAGELQGDHINRNTLDNTRSNLRSGTKAENLQNKRLYRSNTSGYRGVSWDKRSRKWMACARLNGRLHNLGYFRTAEAAGAVALAWRREHMAYSTD